MGAGMEGRNKGRDREMWNKLEVYWLRCHCHPESPPWFWGNKEVDRERQIFTHWSCLRRCLNCILESQRYCPSAWYHIFRQTQHWLKPQKERQEQNALLKTWKAGLRGCNFLLSLVQGETGTSIKRGILWIEGVHYLNRLFTTLEVRLCKKVNRDYQCGDMVFPFVTAFIHCGSKFHRMFVWLLYTKRTQRLC